MNEYEQSERVIEQIAYATDVANKWLLFKNGGIDRIWYALVMELLADPLWGYDATIARKPKDWQALSTHVFKLCRETLVRGESQDWGSCRALGVQGNHTLDALIDFELGNLPQRRWRLVEDVIQAHMRERDMTRQAILEAGFQNWLSGALGRAAMA